MVNRTPIRVRAGTQVPGVGQTSIISFSVNVALTNIPEGELLTGFAMRSDLREGVEDVEGRALSVLE